MNEQARRNIADNLTRLRKYYWLTQKHVAKQLGITESTLSHYENTGAVPDFRLEVLAWYYEVTPDSLIRPWSEVSKQLSPP